ncbi:MarR family transcriptional regulator [Halobellus clavatus]|uniref:IclR helix-turn-helix domain-containing protein n=1 Tax=Halobellus clavatus TaxID=660517 RepID=A0A1H3JDP6_9EURY|nr:MarR family transcriptional regulator [Halobellus clavatus]SDY37538.1 IclR helix-turn-helix domain-containing protein [Halobellus clavatus]
MIRERELRVLIALDTPKGRQELADELDYREDTVSAALNDLAQRDLIDKEREGNRIIAKPSNARCVEVFQSLTQSNPHVDFPDLLTPSMVNILYYLSSDDAWTATELAEQTGHARATIYRGLRTLTNRAMAVKQHSRYRLTDAFNDLHVFAYELQHHTHLVRIRQDVGSGTIVWESHEEFLVRTDTDVEHPDYYRTGLDAFAEYGLQFFTTSERYYFYSEDRESLGPEDLFCHLLLIENDSRHRKYVFLLAAKMELSPERLQTTAGDYGITETVESLVEFLETEGEKSSPATPQWAEFEALADEYEVEL